MSKVFLGFCMFGPVAWLLNSLLFCACAGNPWAVPLDVDMNETIKKEELVIQEELSVNGSIQTSCFGRLGMLLELGFCLADFATDIQMIFLYHKAYHYGFAIVQGCMVLRILLEQVQGFVGQNGGIIRPEHEPHLALASQQLN